MENYPLPQEEPVEVKEVLRAFGICLCPPGTHTFASTRYEKGVRLDVRCCGGCGIDLFVEFE